MKQAGVIAKLRLLLENNLVAAIQKFLCSVPQDSANGCQELSSTKLLKTTTYNKRQFDALTRSKRNKKILYRLSLPYTLILKYSPTIDNSHLTICNNSTEGRNIDWSFVKHYRSIFY